MHYATKRLVAQQPERLWDARRTPYPRQRAKVARVLDTTEHQLWPEVAAEPAEAARPTDSVVAYPSFTDLAAPDWQTLMKGATRQIDLLGVALTQILQTPGVLELLLAKADHGVRIRILVRRPRPELQPLLGHDNIAIRVLAQPGNVIHRFDEQLLLITKFHGEDNDKPHAMLHVRRAAPDGFFDRLAAAFDSLWLHAAPAGTDARAELERAPADSAVEPRPTVPATSQASPTSARHWPRRPT